MPPVSSDRAKTEWWFDTENLTAVKTWLRRLPESGTVEVHPGRTSRRTERYFDTADGRFHLAGFALCIHGGKGRSEASLKTLLRADRNPARLRGFKEPIPRPYPESLSRADGPVSRRIRTLCEPGELGLVAEIRTVRRSFALRWPGGETGELVLDGSVLPGMPQRSSSRLQRVGLDGASEALPVHHAFVEQLRSACSVTPAHESRLDWALRETGRSSEQLPDLGSILVDPTQNVGEVAYAVLRRHFTSWLRHEPGTLLGEDPEHLHDMRVAIRRMRAALRLFAGVFSPEEASQLRTELREVASALGGVRDLDVQIEQMMKLASRLVSVDPAALDPLIDLLERRREAARAEMRTLLRSGPYQRLKASLIRRLPRGPDEELPGAVFPVLLVGAELLRRYRRKVMRAGRRLESSSPAPEYHALRIHCKRFRYALEFMEGVYGPSVRRLVRSLVMLQDLLGAHQDAQIGIAALRALAEAESANLPWGTLLVIGEVAQIYRLQAEKLRGEFPRVFRRLRGRPWKRLRIVAAKATQKQAAEFVRGGHGSPPS
jgi:CHAD domain-containing protein